MLMKIIWDTRKYIVSEHEKWLDEVLPNHKRLTDSVVTILQSLLDSKGVDYLSVTGRTKNKKSALDKIKRKNYDDPATKMTDLSGIRIIVYFESDIEKVSKIIEEAFNIDDENSVNQDKKLSVNQIGYRSVHFVCDIGENRECLPEFFGLKGLKFEFQVRTVLQHAWAELAHDSNYKFTEKLPPKIERSLYLYAGMLELADKGFNELSKEIDKYAESIQKDIRGGDFELAIDVITLREFVENWGDINKLKMGGLPDRADLSDVVRELEQFGVSTIKQLNEIIPNDYVKNINKLGIETNIFGHVRNWMLIHDFEKLKFNVAIDWMVNQPVIDVLEESLTTEQFARFEDIYRNRILRGMK